MSKPKKQHYVPQAYLKNFSYSKKSIQKIYALHKSHGKILDTNIEDIAAKRHFYTVTEMDNPYVWEEIYANKIEPLLNNILTKIIRQCENTLIRDQAIVLTQDMKRDISISVILQLLRGIQSRKFQSDYYNNISRDIIENAFERFSPSDEQKSKILELAIEKEDYFKVASMQAIFDGSRLEKYITLLLRKNFVIYKIIGNMEFVTSDNPVMFMDVLDSNVKPFSNGIISKTTVVYYPISTKLLMAIYDPGLYLGVMSGCDGKIIFLDCYKETSFIKEQNRKQYEQCFDQVYSKSKEVLEDIKK